jgi:predicted amidohydrolase YtcJ
VPSPNVEGFPTHASLSRVSPDNPVILTHASGHAVFVNAKALEISGITRATPNPQGGEILRDGNGDATGLLRETASALALAPPLDEPAIVRTQARLAADEAVAKGITTFEDAGTPFRTLDVLKAMEEHGELPLRLWMMARDSIEAVRAKLAAYRIIGAAGAASRCGRSSSRSTARSARAARGCSSPTPISRAAPGSRPRRSRW